MRNHEAIVEVSNGFKASPSSRESAAQSRGIEFEPEALYKDGIFVMSFQVKRAKVLRFNMRKPWQMLTLANIRPFLCESLRYSDHGEEDVPKSCMIFLFYLTASVIEDVHTELPVR